MVNAFYIAFILVIFYCSFSNLVALETIYWSRLYWFSSISVRQFILRASSAFVFFLAYKVVCLSIRAVTKLFVSISFALSLILFFLRTVISLYFMVRELLTSFTCFNIFLSYINCFPCILDMKYFIIDLLFEFLNMLKGFIYEFVSEDIVVCH